MDKHSVLYRVMLETQEKEKLEIEKRGRPRIHTPEESKEVIKQTMLKYQNKFPFKMTLLNIKTRCKKLGLEFDLTEEYILSILPEFCPVLNIKLTVEKGKGLLPNAASIDRIDPNGGYTKNNIQIISHKANRIKQNATPEELVKVAEWVHKTYKL